MSAPANPFTGRLLPAPRGGGYQDPDYWIWCGSAAQDADGTYHLFASRWPKRFGFGWQWCFNSEVVRCESATPEGPYRFAEVVLPRRDRTFFDGLNTHNPSLRRHAGRWYLYYLETKGPHHLESRV